MIRENLKKVYRVSRSVNPTRHTNAGRIWVSSGSVPLYDYYREEKYLNLSFINHGRQSPMCKR
jgi:hypothetical protein